MDAWNAWKTAFDYDNDYANPVYTSDFYFFQECSETILTDDANATTNPGQTVTREAVFSRVFGNCCYYKGTMSGAWGSGWSNMAMGSKTFPIRDITYGTLSGKNKENRRGYMKGYIDVDGIEIAVYNVHLGWDKDNGDVIADSYYELIELMNEDEYVIVAGDMNGSSIAEYMTAAGYKAANRGDFGDFHTYLYDANHYIDNIFVSPNIDIKSVKVESDKRAYSDHYPLTVEIGLNKDVAGVSSENQPTVGVDGFTTEYR